MATPTSKLACCMLCMCPRMCRVHNCSYLLDLSYPWITVAWVMLCMLMVLQSSRHLNQEQVQLLWTFFQPSGPMLLMLVLYAQSVRYFEQQHIPYEECYAEGRRYLAASRNPSGCIGVDSMSITTPCHFMGCGNPWRGGVWGSHPWLQP